MGLIRGPKESHDSWLQGIPGLGRASFPRGWCGERTAPCKLTILYTFLWCLCWDHVKCISQNPWSAGLLDYSLVPPWVGRGGDQSNWNSLVSHLVQFLSALLQQQQIIGSSLSLLLSLPPLVSPHPHRFRHKPVPAPWRQWEWQLCLPSLSLGCLLVREPNIRQCPQGSERLPGYNTSTEI